MPDFRAIPRELIEDLIPMSSCIELVQSAMVEVSRRNVDLPLRWALRAGARGSMGMMPGYLGKPECYGIKLVSLFPGNTSFGLSSHSGLIVLFEAEHGRPLAVMDAGYVTALRTAAASAIATRVLARADARSVAILGTGEQALFHARAMVAVNPGLKLSIWGRREAKANSLADKLALEYSGTVSIAASADEAVRDADIVCTVTGSPRPILSGRQIRSGCHINAVGASTPDRREIDDEVVLLSRYFTDYRESCLAQAGELRDLISKRIVDETHIVGEIGEVLIGQVTGRTTPGDVTLYRSLGVAVQDLAVAYSAWKHAEAESAGTVVKL